jgi:MFS family permease
VDSAAIAFVAAGTFGVGLGALLVVPPVAIANYFGRRSLGAIRGFTEPFVSGAQAIGAVGAGLVYDLTDSYSLTFPVFTGAALAAALLIVAVRRPTKPVVAPATAAS